MAIKKTDTIQVNWNTYTKETSEQQLFAHWLWRYLERQPTPVTLTCDEKKMKICVGRNIEVTIRSVDMPKLFDLLLETCSTKNIVSAYKDTICIYMVSKKDILKKIHAIYPYLA